MRLIDLQILCLFINSNIDSLAKKNFIHLDASFYLMHFAPSIILV